MSAIPPFDPILDQPLGPSDLEIPYLHTPAGGGVTDAPILPEERLRIIPRLVPGAVPGLAPRPKRVVTAEMAADESSGWFGAPVGTRIPPMAVVEQVSEIVAKEPPWLWPGRIRQGELTMLFGEASAGKTLVVADLISRISRGEALPGETPPAAPPVPAHVLLVSGTDLRRHDTTRILEEAGADTKRVTFTQTIKELNMAESTATPYPLLLPDQLSEIEAILRVDSRIKLVVIDSLENLLDGATGTRLIRRLLLDLDRLAQRFEVAMVVVQRLKGGARWGNELRHLGPEPFLGVPRSIWGVGRRSPEPNAPRVMYPLNLKYRSHGVQQEFELVEGRVVWQDREERVSSVRSVDPTGDPQERLRKFDQASCRLIELLANGAVPRVRLQAQMEQEGFSWRTCERVKQALKIRSVFMPPLPPSTTSQYVWYLPREQDDPTRRSRDDAEGRSRGGGQRRGGNRRAYDPDEAEIEEAEEREASPAKAPKKPLTGMEWIDSVHNREQAKLKALGPGGLPVGMKTVADQMLDPDVVRQLTQGSVAEMMASLVMERLAGCTSPAELEASAQLWSIMDKPQMWLNLEGLLPRGGKLKKSKKNRTAEGDVSEDQVPAAEVPATDVSATKVPADTVSKGEVSAAEDQATARPTVKVPASGPSAPVAPAVKVTPAEQSAPAVKATAVTRPVIEKPQPKTTVAPVQATATQPTAGRPIPAATTAEPKPPAPVTRPPAPPAAGIKATEPPPNQAPTAVPTTGQTKPSKTKRRKTQIPRPPANPNESPPKNP